MNDKVFIGSNAWLYALIQSHTEDEKRIKAKGCITGAVNIIVSTQVVNEGCVNLMRKTTKDNIYIEQFVSDFVATYPVLAQSKEDALHAASIRKDYQFSDWDSLIVACALRSHWRMPQTESMQHDLTIYQQLKICNPFRL